MKSIQSPADVLTGQVGVPLPFNYSPEVRQDKQSCYSYKSPVNDGSVARKHSSCTSKSLLDESLVTPAEIKSIGE